MSAASDGRERAHVNGKCPACGSGGLFVGSGGYLTCPWAECPNPGAPHDALAFTRQSRAEIQAEDGLDKIADDAATNDGRVIVWAVNELTRAVRGVEAAIREGGDRG